MISLSLSLSPYIYIYIHTWRYTFISIYHYGTLSGKHLPGKALRPASKLVSPISTLRSSLLRCAD